MKVLKSRYDSPIYDTHKPFHINFPGEIATNIHSESKYNNGELSNGKKFKLSTMRIDNVHYFLVKDVCKLLNYPSPFQFWNTFNKNFPSFTKTYKKLTSLEDNKVLLREGLITTKESTQRISYVESKIIYQILGSFVVINGSPDDDYYDGLHNEVKESDLVKPEEISKDDDILGINEILPQLASSSKIITTTPEDRKNYEENNSIILPGQGFLSEVNLTLFLKINNYNKEKSSTVVNGNLNKIVKKLNDSGSTVSNVSNNLLNKINKLPLITDKVIKPKHNNRLRYINGLSKFSPLIKNHIDGLTPQELNMVELQHNNVQFNKFLSVFRNWRNKQWVNFYNEKIKLPEDNNENGVMKILEFETVTENEMNLEILKTTKFPNGNNLNWSNISKVKSIYE